MKEFLRGFRKSGKGKKIKSLWRGNMVGPSKKGTVRIKLNPYTEEPFRKLTLICTLVEGVFRSIFGKSKVKQFL